MLERVKKTAKAEQGDGRSFPHRMPLPDASGLLSAVREQILYLQRAVGNRAVQDLFRSGAFPEMRQGGRQYEPCCSGGIPPHIQRQPGPGGFSKGDKVVLKLKTLRMATEPGGNVVAAVLNEGDLLELGDPYRYGGGQVFYATVITSVDEKNAGKAGVVRTDWIRHESAPAAPAAEPVPAPARPTVELYVDNFAEVVYDPDYRLEEGSPTNWMQVIYDDGTTIDIDVYSFDETASGRDTGDSLSRGGIGEGGRFFPLSLNRYTTPRLWAARESALDAAATCTIELMKLAVPAIMFVITIPAMPAGRPADPPLRATRRTVPRTSVRQRPSVPAAVVAVKDILKNKLRELLASGKIDPGGVEANGVYFGAMNVFKSGKQLVARFDVIENVSRIPGRGKEMLKVFEEAAKEVAKESNAESVRIVVGTVQNNAFLEALKAAGYALETEITIGWTKIVNL